MSHALRSELAKVAYASGRGSTWADVQPVTKHYWREVLAQRQEGVGTIYFSSGTTGAPAPVLYDQATLQRATGRAAKLLDQVGVRSSTVSVLFGFGIFPPAHFYHLALVQLGCRVLPLGSGRNMKTESKVDWMLRHPPDVLIGMPSYLRTIGRAARAAGGAIRLRAAITGGEVLHDSMRAEIREMFDTAVFDHYGMLEAPMIAGELTCGHLHVVPEYGVEVLTAGGVQDHGRGELVVSSLEAWPHPLLRLRTGDVVTVTLSQCAVSTTPIVAVHGRADDGVKLRGRLLDRSELDACLRRAGVVEYFVKVSYVTAGDERVEVTYEGKITASAVEQVLRRRFDVEAHATAADSVTLPLTDTGKPTRFVDER